MLAMQWRQQTDTHDYINSKTKPAGLQSDFLHHLVSSLCEQDEYIKHLQSLRMPCHTLRFVVTAERNVEMQNTLNPQYFSAHHCVLVFAAVNDFRAADRVCYHFRKD